MLDRALDLHPQVSVRPEPFGALLYHFGTRRLSFLKDRLLLEVVQQLALVPTAREACNRAGIQGPALLIYERALQTLLDTNMLQVRDA